MADLASPLISEHASTERTPGTLQGVLLVAMSCLAVLGAVLLAPVLPAMQDAFAGTPGVAVLVPVSLTIPALMIGLLSPFAGSIIDRLGRKRLLVGALVAYGFLGMAPLVLDSLPAIVATRAGVGITEAAIMTCCTTLIVDYWTGDSRAKWLGMQTVGAAVGATLFFAAGGLLGAVSWRAPFWLYAVAFLFAVLAARYIWQPVKPAAEAHREIPPFPFKVLLVPVLITVFGGVVFYTPIVEVSFVLDDAGVKSTAIIGAVGALASLSTAIGGIAFGRLGRYSTRTLLSVAFTLAGLGLIVFALADSVPLIVVGVVVACIGTGLLLPTLLTWAVSRLEFDERGRGTGLWTAAMFIGQFFCPLLVLALTGLLSGLSAALVVVGAVSLAMVLLSRAVVRDV
jgi:MFS family permease